MSVHYLVLVIGIVLMTACAKNPRCLKADENRGIIANSLIVKCMFEITENNFIIDSDSSFFQAFQGSNDQDVICELPEVDFEKHTLLGLKAKGQCETRMIREVEKHESEKRYHYKVIVKSCGTCKKLSINYNWVLVPKLPNDWNVTFEILEK